MPSLKSDIQKHCLILAVVCAGVVIACLFQGCAGYYFPEQAKITEIEQSKYARYKNDCIDKAIAAHRHLTSTGHMSRVVSGYVTGNRPHAWVEAEKDGEWYLIDPTVLDIVDGYPIEQYENVYTREQIYIGDEFYHLDENPEVKITYRSNLFWMSLAEYENYKK